jgi:hypothetical protein
LDVPACADHVHGMSVDLRASEPADGAACLLEEDAIVRIGIPFADLS